ncbi:MAG: hypothetical protein JWM80_2638 [Cyanobacteria bacterium RYN_339]|nr:hypothetical protein [Cyanobacteria bacterium RYN_339]
MRRFLLSVALGLAFAAPAAATPGPRPLYTDPGNHGVVLDYQLQGTLGVSGISVRALPTMLLVTAIAPGSPAALVDLPSPAKYRVRIAAIDGVVVEELPESALKASFGSDREEVTLTLGRKGPQDVEEILVGPFHVPLSARAVNHKQADLISAQGRFGEAVTFAEPGELAERSLLAANDAAAAGDPDRANALASVVTGATGVRTRAQLLRLEAAEDRQRELLDRADFLAEQGNFPAALKMLEGVQATGAFGDLRHVRETDWRRALEARQAIKDEAERPQHKRH